MFWAHILCNITPGKICQVNHREECMYRYVWGTRCIRGALENKSIGKVFVSNFSISVSFAKVKNAI